MSRSSWVGRLAGFALVVLASACTSDHKSPTDVVPSNSVSIANFAFAPSGISVAVGTTVTWTNKDGTAHTVTGGGFDSGALAKNASFSQTFNTKGTFTYHCSIHPEMTASVTVQ